MLGLKIAITGLIAMVMGILFIQASANPFSKADATWGHLIWGFFMLILTMSGAAAIIAGTLIAIWV